jgi:hypothetical protein
MPFKLPTRERPVHDEDIWNTGYESVTLPPFCVGDLLDTLVRGYVLQRLLHNAFEGHMGIPTCGDNAQRTQL